MYVTGRGTTGFGTILPALAEWKRQGGSIGNVWFAGTDGQHSQEAKLKADELASLNGIELDMAFYPQADQVDHNTYKELLARIPRPACAIIVVPDHLHYQVARDCLEADLPVLVVKPLTPTVEEGLALMELARERKRYAAVEFHKRWDKANLMMRDTIRSGRIGDPLYCWVEYSQRKSIPSEVFRAWAEKTTILQYLGIHYIDMVRFLTRATPKRVMCIGQKNWLSAQGIDTYDSMQTLIEWQFPDGNCFTQTLLNNWIDPETSSAMSDQKIKMVGTGGRFESDQKERGVRINIDGACQEQPNPDFCMAYGSKPGEMEWRGYGIDSVRCFLDDVCALERAETTVDELEQVRPTFAEALISTAVVEAAHVSLQENNSWQPVQLINN
jgi:predicted dehydrogenase